MAMSLCMGQMRAPRADTSLGPKESFKLQASSFTPQPPGKLAMDPRSWFSSLTGYFVYILSVATLGPLLFGFHLVCPHDTL